MSSPWRITRGDEQFTIKDVAELKLQAAAGKILSGDLIQPPGSTDWLYATEVKELKGLVKAPKLDLDEDELLRRAARGKSSGAMMRAVMVLLVVGIVGGGIFVLYNIYTTAPDSADNALFGDGEHALNPLEALATEYASLLSEPDSRSKEIGEVKKDERVQLVRKLGDFYEVSLKDGKTGWVGVSQVVPGYLFNQELVQKYDPLFNPDRYLMLVNYAWTPAEDEDNPKEDSATLTTMQFALSNPTEYGMAGVILKVGFKDGSDRDIDTKSFEVPRLLPPGETLHLEGIEVDIEWDEDTRAEVDIYGARALLPKEFERLMAEEKERLKREADEAEESDKG